MMGMLPHSGLLVYISGQMLETTAPVVERRLYAAVLRKASATDGAAVSTVGTCTRQLPERSAHRRWRLPNGRVVQTRGGGSR